VPGSGGPLDVQAGAGLNAALAEALGGEVRVLIASEDSATAEREQWDDADNFLASRPARCWAMTATSSPTGC
jgi:arginine deiminase